MAGELPVSFCLPASAQMEMTMRIVFEGVGKTRKYYDGQNDLWRQQVVLRDLTFQVEDAEIFTILGPSGAGKSTLLRLVNRLEDPSQGHIMLDGQYLHLDTGQ